MQGFCPNCNANLTEDTNTILTKESSIFKGHNVYCMCTHCGYVMVYNLDRDLVFSLDRFKDDPEIIDEIQQLLTEAGNSEVELISQGEKQEELEEHHSCEGSCSSCKGCSNKDTLALQVINEGDLLVVNKETNEVSILSRDNLDKINIDKYDFFELNPVIVERVVSYKVQRI